MARTRYREKLAMVYAVQYTGSNLAELEEFAPELIFVQEGVVHCHGPDKPLLPFTVNVTDWLIDDPYIGYIKPITNSQFQARFDPTPQAESQPT